MATKKKVKEDWKVNRYASENDLDKALRVLVIIPNVRFSFGDFAILLSKFVSASYVIPYNPLFNILKYIPIPNMSNTINTIKAYYIKEKLCPPSMSQQLDVQFVPVFFFKRYSTDKSIGDKIAGAIGNFIRKSKLEFDLIHAHFTWPFGYAGVRLAKEFDVPVVITIHEDRDWLLKEYKSNDDKIYWTWRNADALIRVNKQDVSLLREFNPNVYSIPNGVNLNKFTLLNRSEARLYLGLPHHKKIVFNLGGLYDFKGHKYLIEAMNYLVRERDDVLCFIGGEGPLKDKLKGQIKSLGLKDYIKLIGFVPDKELVYWMNAADLFVLPSLSESFGIVQIEAMACGTPVVATINGGSEEIVTSEDYGLLCPPKDPECLAEKILIALDREWNRKKIREYAQQFAWENIVREVIKIYTTLLR